MGDVINSNDGRDWNPGKNPIHRMRCGVRNSAPAASWTNAPLFARKGQNAILATILAKQAKESMRGDTAGQVIAEFPFEFTS
jgi:hypothetical protein